MAKPACTDSEPAPMPIFVWSSALTDNVPLFDALVPVTVELSMEAFTPSSICAIETEADTPVVLPKLPPAVTAIASPTVVLVPPASAWTATLSAVTCEADPMVAVVRSESRVTATAPAMPTV